MSNQQKNIGLLIGFLASVFIAYNFSIKKTIAFKNRNFELIQEKNLVDNAVAKIQFLQQKNNSLTTFLTSKNVSLESSFQQMLLEKVTQFSKDKNITTIAFNKPHKVQDEQTTIETYSFKLKGDYVSLIKLINHLEQEQLGKLISVNFEKKKNYKTNRYYLTSTIFLQKITNQ